MRFLLFPLTFLLFVHTALGQVQRTTITGRVVDDESDTPLAGVHVFVASSTSGTVTNENGIYRLDNIPVGALRLYASSIGYEPVAKDMFLRTADTKTIDFRLKAAVVELDGITVEAKRDKKWKRRLERFTTMFIGESSAARETKIINPEVLDFEMKRAVFRATASEPLIIENRFLGYKITYFLKNFESDQQTIKYDGEPLYEELTPQDDAERTKWEENRKRSFIGSFRHFALALIAQKTEEQGFKLYGRNSAGIESVRQIPQGSRFPVRQDEIIEPGASNDEFVLDFRGFVEIIFTGEFEDAAYKEYRQSFGNRDKYQTSWIRLSSGATVIDYKGDTLDPYGVTLYGYFAFERVADDVPRDYRPG